MGDIELTITVDEEVARTISTFPWSSRDLVTIAAVIAAALPKPRPAEPMGLGAVVRDGEGRDWVRTAYSGQPWQCREGDWGEYNNNIPGPIEVLSEGVIL